MNFHFGFHQRANNLHLLFLPGSIQSNILTFSRMQSVDEALSVIKRQTPAFTQSEFVPVRKAFNRILAEEITAKHDIPNFDNSAMDGFVLQKSDWDNGQRTYKISGEIRPEDSTPAQIPNNACFRIMTGARVPENGTQVIPVEWAEESGGSVSFSGLPGKNPIRRKGEGYRSGKVVLPAGVIVREQEMGLLIESGNAECTILRPIRISVQVTGSEIDDLKNTNGPIISALARRWPGAIVKEWPVLGDHYDEVVKRLQTLKQESDLILTTGGISAGKHDYLYRVLNELGAECLIRKVKQKPGKPFTFHLWDGVPVCSLPGNPISAVFTAELYARDVLFRMLSVPVPRVSAVLQRNVNNPGSRSVFSPGKITIRDGRLLVDTDGSMRSHLLQLLSGQHGFVRIESGTAYKKGELVDVIPFSSAAFFLL